MREGSHTRWVVGTVGAGIVALLSYFAARDRNAVDQDLLNLRAANAGQMEQIAQARRELSAAEVREQAFASDLQDLKLSQRAMNEKLDRVLLELRRR